MLKCFFFNDFFIFARNFDFIKKISFLIEYMYRVATENREKSGKLQLVLDTGKSRENAKKSGISKFAHNSLKLLLPIIVIINPIIVKIVKLYMTFTVKYVQNLCILNDFNKIIKILFNSVIFICPSFSSQLHSFFQTNLFFTVV